jgi:hypothetical protein
MNTDKIIIEAHNEGQETTANGIVSINPNKKEFGSIRLATTSYDMSSGFLNKQRRVHYLAGKVDELEGLVDAYDLKIGGDYSAKFPSRIIVEESATPFYEGQSAKINPSTGEVVMVNGSEVYRQTRLVPAGSADQDSLVKEGQATTVAELTSEDLPELS